VVYADGQSRTNEPSCERMVTHLLYLGKHPQHMNPMLNGTLCEICGNLSWSDGSVKKKTKINVKVKSD